MRCIILIIIAVVGSLSVNAQIIENGESNPIWGLKATYDVNLPGKVHSNVVNDNMFRAGSGVTIGAVCNIYLGKKFYLEPGVSLFYDTYSYKDLIIAGIENYEERNPKIYKIGFRLPVVVGYCIEVSDQISVAPFTGPEFSYAYAGDIKLHDKNRLGSPDLSLFGYPGYQRRVECGWKIGLAFFSGMWSFNIDGTFGMTNLMTDGSKFHERRGTVSVTRYF